jgi:hypothetical protein
MTQFESLADDILLDLFEYFEAVHLLSVFFNLNSHFNTLLYKHFRAYHLDFRYIWKSDFDYLCQVHLHSIIDRIGSFNMADKDETPGLVELFLSRGFTISQMVNLRSLTLYNIDVARIIQLVSRFDRLIYLVDLDLNHCFDWPPGQHNELYLINQIWSLPKLRRFKMASCVLGEIYFNDNTPISSTLEYLSIRCIIRPLDSTDLNYLFLYTPCLRFLSAHIELKNENSDFRIIETSLTTLNMAFLGETQLLSKLFQNMPCLRHLTIEMRERNLRLDGDQWKKIIVDCIPQLKVFRFDMCVSSCTTEQQVDQLLDTFRTPFWLHERHWYARCDWEEELNHQVRSVRCYTLPYAFDMYTDFTEHVLRSKWTCSNDRNYWPSDRTHIFNCRNSKNDYRHLYPVSFSKINKLVTRIPVPDTIWFNIPTFDYLTKLEISISGEDCQSKFQALLDRAPHLYNLTAMFFLTPSCMTTLFSFRSPSIRRLRINPHARHPHFDFDHSRCTEFLRSPLALQCEVVELRIRCIDDLLILINSMRNLRAMTVHITDASHLTPRLTENELMNWIQTHLPTRYKISSYPKSIIAFVIKLWIG